MPAMNGYSDEPLQSCAPATTRRVVTARHVNVLRSNTVSRGLPCGEAREMEDERFTVRLGPSPAGAQPSRGNMAWRDTASVTLRWMTVGRCAAALRPEKTPPGGRRLANGKSFRSLSVKYITNSAGRKTPDEFFQI